MKGLLAAISNREGNSARQLYSAGTLVSPDALVSDIPGNRTWIGDLSTFPPWPGAYIPNDPQHRYSTAAGGWQFLKGTYASIATITKLFDFSLSSQIINAATLAVHDFKARSGGGDLLITVKAGKLALVSEMLIDTWPGGADAKLPSRYTANLALFTQAPAPQPIPAPIPAPTTPNLVALALGGNAHVVQLEGVDQAGGIIPLATTGVVVIDDPRVCQVIVTVDLQGLLISPLALGDTFVHYSIGSALLDPPIEVNVAPPSLRSIRVKTL